MWENICFLKPSEMQSRLTLLLRAIKRVLMHHSVGKIELAINEQETVQAREHCDEWHT